MKAFYVQLNKCASTSLIRLIGSYPEIECMQVREEWKPYERRKALKFKLLAEKGRTELNRSVFGPPYDEWFKFTFVRNPWDRLVSSWKWVNFIKGRPRGLSFVDFVTRVHEMYGGLGDFSPWTPEAAAHFQPQSWNLQDSGGKMDISFIGKVESLLLDFTRLCDLLGLDPPKSVPWVNKSGGGNDSNLFTPELEKLVREVYQEDIERFGYEGPSCGIE